MGKETNVAASSRVANAARHPSQHSQQQHQQLRVDAGGARCSRHQCSPAMTAAGASCAAPADRDGRGTRVKSSMIEMCITRTTRRCEDRRRAETTQRSSRQETF